MKISGFFMRRFFNAGFLVLCFIMQYGVQKSFAQSRSYQLVYSDNIRGGCTMFGNTLMQVVNNGIPNLTKMNGNSYNGSSVYGNDNENMQYVDIDSLQPFGNTTRNSSSAVLNLPAGKNTIKIARLYWGGYVKNSDFDLAADSNKTIKIRKDNDVAYTNFPAVLLDQISTAIGYTEYQAYADVTSLLQKNGAGNYQVGNAALSTGAVGGGNHGGWCIVVVYENDQVAYNSIRMYDGFEQIYDGSLPLSRQVTLNGLDVPSGELVAGDARMGILTWEGDASLRKDYLKINNHFFYNAMNQVDNPWNGTISDNGVSVSSRIPDYSNQMGVDIDMFDVGSGFGIDPNATSVNLEFGTEADQYYPGVFMFSIRMKDPKVSLDIDVDDENHNAKPEVNETLTYTLRALNNGVGTAHDVVVYDTLPASVRFVPGSLITLDKSGRIKHLTDAADEDAAEIIDDGIHITLRFRPGLNETAGGSLASGEMYKLWFQVKIADPGPGRAMPSIINIARLYAKSDAGVTFIDDGFSFLNPEAGPLPVFLTNFSAIKNGENVSLEWITSMEINCRNFNIQSSSDGKNFKQIASLNGYGTSAVEHRYTFTDHPDQKENIVFYRLVQVDVDGRNNFSNVLQVRMNTDNASIKVFPNPFADKIQLFVQSQDRATVANVKIYNVAGVLVKQFLVKIVAGKNVIELTGVAFLSKGSYLLQVCGEGLAVSQQIIKQ